jgi:hypothetical protein
MSRQLLLAALAGTLIAALPAPDPVITVEGAAAAAKLGPELRAALAPRITALNQRLEQVRAVRTASVRATPAEQTRLHASLGGIHEECMKLYQEISGQLDAGQREAFMAYLHAQLKAAGLEPAHLHGGAHLPHGVHPSPGIMPHSAGGPGGA